MEEPIKGVKKMDFRTEKGELLLSLIDMRRKKKKNMSKCHEQIKECRIKMENLLIEVNKEKFDMDVIEEVMDDVFKDNSIPTLYGVLDPHIIITVKKRSLYNFRGKKREKPLCERDVLDNRLRAIRAREQRRNENE